MKFGTDGVRGTANVELTAEFALRLGRAAARVLASDDVRSVVVGGDTRQSTPLLDAALSAGFASEGVDVIRLGVAPTPAVAEIARRRGALGAVVSGSHNPYGDNGIKLFAAGGAKLPDAVQERIEADLARLPAPSATPGTIEDHPDDWVDVYLDHLRTALGGRRAPGLRVVVDSANGAAHRLAPSAMQMLGVDVIATGDRPNGTNINDGCGATAPDALAAAVVARGADLGVALDGDADRLIAVDASGTVVDGDHIIAMCAIDMQRRGALRGETVVVTVMSNFGFRRAMDAAGIDIVETAVGDRYVLEALSAGGFSLGGEQSGHVVFADHATTGDGLLTALALLDVVHRSGRTLGELAAATMTTWPQVLLNVPVAARVPDAADRLADEIDAARDRLGDRGRVLVRPSGTEPLVRVMVEAEHETQAQSVASELADAARSRLA